VNADDQVYQSKTFAAGISIQSHVSTVRTEKMPKVTSENLAITGRTLTADYVTTKKRAREVLSDLCGFGTSGNVSLGWGIWPDGDSSGAYQLALEARPSTPAYSVDIRYLQGNTGWDGENYANRILVLYNNGASWATAQDTTEQGSQWPQPHSGEGPGVPRPYRPD
jgi:hypothetical protein